MISNTSGESEGSSDNHKGETRGNDMEGNGDGVDNRGGNGEDSGRGDSGGSEWSKGLDN